LIREISARRKRLPNGKTYWLALERDIDKDTNGVTVIRRQRTANEQEAKKLAQKWQEEYNREKKAGTGFNGENFDSAIATTNIPTDQADLEDLIKAKNRRPETSMAT